MVLRRKLSEIYFNGQDGGQVGNGTALLCEDGNA
jgi:hypothetical protein